jgi:geranylgeranyl diphosphate synthase type I
MKRGTNVYDTELSGFLGYWLPRIETELRAAIPDDEPAVAPFYHMMRYHLGWMDEQFREQNFPAGKRLRPILCLLACAQMGGDPANALPAAAALEILHNFSLVHDDIEDGDETRRHRPTVWKLWGIPQAINVGDGMYTLAFATLQRLTRRNVAAETTLAVLDLFTQTCLRLTEGQYLDMSFEQRSDVTISEYMRMVRGKTAALVGASAAMGALIGGATAGQVGAIERFGRSMGLAFQIQDDLLGIWGDSEVTGKPAGNDILRRKKSLPILHALNHDRVGEHFETLLATEPGRGHLQQALALLEQAGTREFVEGEVRRQHDTGVTALHEALGERAAGSALLALAESLLHRRA